MVIFNANVSNLERIIFCSKNPLPFILLNFSGVQLLCNSIISFELLIISLGFPSESKIFVYYSVIKNIIFKIFYFRKNIHSLFIYSKKFLTRNIF